VLFHFGLDRDSIEGSLAAGVWLWVTLLLATVPGRDAPVRRPSATGRLRADPAGPDRPHAVFLGKAATLLAFLVPSRSSPCPHSTSCFARHAAGRDAGAAGGRGPGRHRTAAVGALVAALGAETDARQLIVPLLLLRLSLPVVNRGRQARRAAAGDPATAEHLGRWLGILTLYDLTFVLVSLGVFDYLLED